MKAAAKIFGAPRFALLFLDETGDLPPEMQLKLRRLVQDGEFAPLDDEKAGGSDGGMIAASDHDLKTGVTAGRFWEDVYYRLRLFPIEAPPLRERKEDIPILLAHFLRVACERFNRPSLQVTENQIRLLQEYDWPGNLRELEIAVERAVIAAPTDSLRFDLPETAANRRVRRR
jgi:transcriptional regulator with GAF, ATPase, and Fis domain